MADSVNFTIIRFQDPLSSVVHEVLEFQLPNDFNLIKIKKYFESSKSFHITSSYYEMEYRESLTQTGAGGSTVELLVKIYQQIPDELKWIVIDALISSSFSQIKKIFSKLFPKHKKIKDTAKKYNKKLSEPEIISLKKGYKITTDEIEVIEYQEIIITRYVNKDTQ